jgi:hypothetical protein
MDALKLEIHNVGVAFEVLEDGKSAPQGWTKASGHIIWDLKMDFTRNPPNVDRLDVAGGLNPGLSEPGN